MYSLNISNDGTAPLYNEHFTSKREFEEVKELCQSRPYLDFFWKRVMVENTDINEGMIPDLFLPTLPGVLYAINFDRQTKAAMVAIDILTIPVRFATLLPRIYMNRKESHPLHQYLVSKGVEPSTINQRVHVNFEATSTDNIAGYIKTLSYSVGLSSSGEGSRNTGTQLINNHEPRVEEETQEI